MNKVFLNLLNFPPSEGSKAAHEAWKENVRMVSVACVRPIDWTDLLYFELQKPGYVTKSCRDAAKAYADLLTKSVL